MKREARFHALMGETICVVTIGDRSVDLPLKAHSGSMGSVVYCSIENQAFIQIHRSSDPWAKEAIQRVAYHREPMLCVQRAMCSEGKKPTPEG